MEVAPLLQHDFSTMINVYMRFDDSVTKTPGYDSYVQTNEVLSFGLSYKW